MTNEYQIVVCGSLVPDPLQSLIPMQGPAGPALKNEMMLPVTLDPWAAHALYEAGHLAKNNPGSKVWLVSLGPKAKLQQLMMAVAQKLSFELIVLDGPASGFTDASEVADALSGAIEKIPGLDREKLLVFGGCSSASRDAGVTMQMVGENLGIDTQFTAVDVLETGDDGFKVQERVEAGEYLVSKFTSLPAVLGWATGKLPEPPNDPRTGMMNMRTIMPAIQRAAASPIASTDITFQSIEVPQQTRDTRIVKDMDVNAIADELVAWIQS